VPESGAHQLADPQQQNADLLPVRGDVEGCELVGLDFSPG